MSISARNWAWSLYASAGGSIPLKPGEKLVLLCLAEHESAELGYSFPSQKRIAEKTCLSERSVRTHLDALEQMGAFTTEKRRSKQGRWMRNVYVLNVPEDYREKDPEWMREREGRTYF